MKKILITGGCGYVGSRLIEKLINKYQIKNIDTQWFGNKLGQHSNLINIKEDIRNLKNRFIDWYVKFIKNINNFIISIKSLICVEYLFSEFNNFIVYFHLFIINLILNDFKIITLCQ